MSSFKEENTIYKAIIRRDSPAVNAFLAQGESVPEFLYLQVTNHDHLAVLQFMLNIEPEKKRYAAKLSVGQGAVTCTKFFLETASIKDCDEFKTLLYSFRGVNSKQWLNITTATKHLLNE